MMTPESPTHVARKMAAVFGHYGPASLERQAIAVLLDSADTIATLTARLATSQAHADWLATVLEQMCCPIGDRNCKASIAARAALADYREGK